MKFIFIEILSNLFASLESLHSCKILMFLIVCFIKLEIFKNDYFNVALSMT